MTLQAFLVKSCRLLISTFLNIIRTCPDQLYFNKVIEVLTA